jgi:hypothetical protein
MTKIIIDATIPMGMMIVITDDVITPTSPENFIYIIDWLIILHI